MKKLYNSKTKDLEFSYDGKCVKAPRFISFEGAELRFAVKLYMDRDLFCGTPVFLFAPDWKKYRRISSESQNSKILKSIATHSLQFSD